MSERACPTVHVLKPDSNVGICGDHLLTTVDCLLTNQYITTVKCPLPSVEDVIARVGDAKVFSKL